MNRRRLWLTVVGVIAVLLGALMLSGCGSGGGETGGEVTGRIVDVTSGLGIGNVVVTVAGQSGTSTTPDGRFRITKIRPAGNYALQVQPGVVFVAVPGPQVRVNVPASGAVEVGTVVVIDRALLPPAP